MASVRKRNWTNRTGEHEAWQVTYTDERGKRKSGGQFERKKDADAALRKIQDEIERGIHVPKGEALTFAEVGELFIARCQDRHDNGDKMGGTRIRQIKSHVEKHLYPEFGALKISAFLDTKPIQDWLDKRKVKEICTRTGQRYKVVTLKQICADLSMLLDHAVKEKLGLKINPLRTVHIKLPDREDDDEIRFMEASDASKLLRWALTRTRQARDSSHVFRTMPIAVIVAMLAGLRRGEICALDWENVKLDDWVIDVRRNLARYDGMKTPKTKRSRRVVPMNPVLHAVLEEHARRHDWPTSGPFILNENGHRVRPDSITSFYWPKAAEEAGLVDESGERLYRFHDLRHAAGSFWLADGMPLEEVSRLLGHSRIDTTWNTYIHKLQHDQRALQAIQNVSNRFVHLMDKGGLQLPVSDRPLMLEAPPQHQGPAIEGAVQTVNGELMPIEVLAAWQQQVIDLCRGGETIHVIAAKVGRGRAKVVEFLESAGLYEKTTRRGWRTSDNTEEDVTAALARWQAGEAASVIATDYAVVESTVRRWAREAGATRTPRKAGPKKPRAFYSFSPEVKADALAMWRAGRPSTEIAEKIGAQPPTVMGWARKAGLHRRGKGWKSVVSELDAAPGQHDAR